MATPPTNVQFSPDGAYVTFLDCPPGSKIKELYAVDLASKVVLSLAACGGVIFPFQMFHAFVQAVTALVKPQNQGNTEETLSFEEKMRRERLRDLSVGVTEYQWCVAIVVRL